MWTQSRYTEGKHRTRFRGKKYILTIFTNPSARAGYDTFFKQSLTGLNSVFSFSYTSCLTKAEEPSVLYYLPIAGGRIFGFIPFPSVLMLCEMQSVPSRIWTRVAVSTSYNDNHYTMERYINKSYKGSRPILVVVLLVLLYYYFCSRIRILLRR